MKPIVAELTPLYAVKQADANLFMQWVWKVRQLVNFDQDTLSYPRSCMTRASSGDETLMMVPLQPVLMFESMVRNPDITDLQSAICLRKIADVVEAAMVDTMHREAYFMTNNEKEADLCAARGWTKALYDPEKNTWLMKRKHALAEIQHDRS